MLAFKIAKLNSKVNVHRRGRACNRTCIQSPEINLVLYPENSQNEANMQNVPHVIFRHCQITQFRESLFTPKGSRQKITVGLNPKILYQV